MNRHKCTIFTYFLLSVISSAQYFGRNKPGYKVFDYQVYSTPNFEIYHYLKNDSVLEDFALRCEQWYNIHQDFIGDTLLFKNPVILYENHGDFQQTNISTNTISIGVGGFTEGLKNRVVLPLSLSSAQTDHVLGHELVHAFQYNYLMHSSGLSIREIGNIPLWMIEGMAEYLSTGSNDPVTAMWLRDDVLHNTLPTIYKISTDPKYNPYRYGQAFWAFADQSLKSDQFGPLMVNTARTGLKKAFENNLETRVELKPKGKKTLFKKKKKSISEIRAMGYENFDTLWQQCIMDHYQPYLENHEEKIIGDVLFDITNAGNYNFAPSISPDGEHVIFMSEKELFTIDLFLAETKTGKIKKRFSKIINENEVDAFNFIESSGTWSPDGRYFAYAVYEKGRNVILIVDIEKGKVVNEIKPEGLNEISYPSWGKNNILVFSASKNGLTDLYTYEIDSKNLKNITKNGKSNIQPQWSFDGKMIVYVTEGAANSNTAKKGKNIAIYYMETGEIKVFDIFPGANNLNPQFSPDQHSVFFLSDRDGFRNMYRYDFNEKKVFQSSDYFTGITGMTQLSPAISISQNGQIVYSYYSNHKFTIYKANIKEFIDAEEIANSQHVDFKASELPSLNTTTSNVTAKLDNRNPIVVNNKNRFTQLKYRPKFQLDYISEISAGVSTGLMRPGASGGSTAIFSDIVGNNQLFVNVNINGTIYDFGGVVAYLNRKHRLNYGFSISHIPYYMGSRWAVTDTTVTIDGEDRESDIVYFDQYRILESQMMIMGYYPVSSTMRFEGALSATRNGYKFNRYSNYYDSTANLPYLTNLKEIESPDPNFFVQTDLAFVLDNSYFGLTSPLRGTRSRIQISKNFGYLDYYSTLFDFRKYYFVKPMGIAFRFLNYNRLGQSADKNYYNSLYLAYPWYVRGYYGLSFNNESREITEQFSSSKLQGSKMIVSNVELRIPFTGPERLCLIGSRFLFSDLVLFADAGIIWENNSTLNIEWKQDEDIRSPIYSAGVSLRINLFGYLILEPYYAFPFQLYNGVKGIFGFNFVPGW